MSFTRPISRPPAEREKIAREACRSVIHAYGQLITGDDERLIAIRRKILKLEDELQEYLYHYGDA